MALTCFIGNIHAIQALIIKQAGIFQRSGGDTGIYFCQLISCSGLLHQRGVLVFSRLKKLWVWMSSYNSRRISISKTRLESYLIAFCKIAKRLKTRIDCKFIKNKITVLQLATARLHGKRLTFCTRQFKALCEQLLYKTIFKHVLSIQRILLWKMYTF